MKKFMKKFNKYRMYIVAFVFIVILIGLIFSVKAFLYPTDAKSVYGNRLNGIENVEITSAKQNTIIKNIKVNSVISDAKIQIKGKIINILITVTSDFSIDSSKELFNKILSEFSDKEIAFYDFQFFSSNDNLKYKLIGYKNKTTEEIIYSQVSEVK